MDDDLIPLAEAIRRLSAIMPGASEELRLDAARNELIAALQQKRRELSDGSMTTAETRVLQAFSRDVSGYGIVDPEDEVLIIDPEDEERIAALIDDPFSGADYWKGCLRIVDPIAFKGHVYGDESRAHFPPSRDPPDPDGAGYSARGITVSVAQLEERWPPLASIKAAAKDKKRGGRPPKNDDVDVELALEYLDSRRARNDSEAARLVRDGMDLKEGERVAAFHRIRDKIRKAKEKRRASEEN
jgi:hypothetical protein